MVDLENFGGLELQIADFLQYSFEVYGATHAIMLSEGKVHKLLDARIRRFADPVLQSQYVLGHRLNWKSKKARRILMAITAHRTEADIRLFWNRLAGNNHAVLESTALGSRRNVLWDRGASWQSPDNKKSRLMIDRMDYAIANSHASRRMLELRWGFERPITVCRNALRPSLLPTSGVGRSFPSGRTIVLGVASRLVAGKGVSIAIRAVAAACSDGLDVELHIAGEGDQLTYLKRLSEDLGITERVLFLGLVEDMESFYTTIDSLIHFSLRESFGQILVEAMSYGCPVIATMVDGMAEIVRDGVDGYLVKPVIELGDRESEGEISDGLAPFVYDPVSDAIVPPRVVAPRDAARCIAAVFSDSNRYENMSAAAVKRARQDFKFEDHMTSVFSCLSKIAAA